VAAHLKTRLYRPCSPCLSLSATEHPLANSNMVISLDFVKFSPNPLRFQKTPNLKKALRTSPTGRVALFVSTAISKSNGPNALDDSYTQYDSSPGCDCQRRRMLSISTARTVSPRTSTRVTSVGAVRARTECANNTKEVPVKSWADNMRAHDFLESARAVYLAKTLILQPISKARRSNLEPCRI